MTQATTKEPEAGNYRGAKEKLSPQQELVVAWYLVPATIRFMQLYWVTTKPRSVDEEPSLAFRWPGSFRPDLGCRIAE